MDPDEQANDESEHRWNQLSQGTVRAPNVVVSERRQVNTHESNQRSEVEQLRAIVVSDEECSQQCNRADENHVVGGNPGLGVNGPEEFSRNSIATSHSIKQAGCSELRSHARTHGGNQQCEA